MKKIYYVIFIIILVIFLNTTLSLATENQRILKDFVNEELIARKPEEMPKELKENTLNDYRKENKKREKAYEKGIQTWLEPYMTETVPENQRIKEYQIVGSAANIVGDKLKANIYVQIVPYSENSAWNQEFSGTVFTTFGVYDGEYLIEKALIYPENYDKFLEQFEEYQKNDSVKTEKVEVQAKKVENMESVQVEKMSNVMFITSAIVFVLLISIVFIQIVKRRKNKIRL